MDDFSVLNWYSPTTGSPNYLNFCNTNDAGVPQNSWGNQNAYTGNAYAGFHTSDFETNLTNAREYMQCKLMYPLEKDEYYEVSFYVSRADSSRRACDNIGIYISEDKISSYDNLALSVIPQIKSPDYLPIVNDTSWVRIIDTIKAIGDEVYLTLGVFSNNSETAWVNVAGSAIWPNEAYYYIDEVSIRKVYNIPNVITPNDDGLNDFIDFSNFPMEIEIFNRWGNKVYSNQNTPIWSGRDNYDNELNEGVYYYRIENKAGFIQLIR